MSNNKKRKPKYSKKSMKAISHLNAIYKESEEIKNHLEKLSEYLYLIIDKKIDFRDHPPSKGFEEKNVKKEKKTESSTFNIDRICFAWLGIDMHIDFKLTALDSTEGSKIVGCVVYSAARQRKNGTQRMNESECQLYSYDEKPILSIFVDSDGRVTAPGALDEEWWVYDGKEDLPKEYYEELAAEIHYMVREKMWNKALDWMNEGVIP